MVTRQPKPYHHGDLRRALIMAGMELLAEGGGAALDLRKVARKAGVSHAAPYRHFADKRALLAAIAEEGFIRLTEHLKPALNQTNPETQLLDLARFYVNFALTEPALTREMFSGLTIDRLAYESLHAASKRAFEILLEIVQRQQAIGAYVQDDPVKLAVVIWSMLHGLAMLLLENQILMITVDQNPAVVDEQIQRSIAYLYDGLRPR